MKGIQLLIIYSEIAIPYVAMGTVNRNILQVGRA